MVQFLTRPVEYTYTGTSFTVGATAFNAFPQGTYANPLSLAHSFAAAICNEGTYTIALSMSSSFLIGLTPSGSSPTITWDDTTIRDIFGFTGASTALSDGVTTYASYTPLYCWIPTFYRDDQDYFTRDLPKVAVGTISADGTWSGIGSGSTIYQQTIKFPQELETNLCISAYGTTTYKQDRCLETFLIGALTAYPSDATYVSPKGFWYYEDSANVISDCALSSTEPWSEATNIGVNFGLDSGADTKVFCSVSPNQLRGLRQSPGLAVSRTRYNYTFSFQTCPVPVEGWQYVDYTP